MRYCPPESVVTLRTFSISAGLVTSTVTPGITASCASRTVPAICPSCANAAAGTSTSIAAIARNTFTPPLMSSPPLFPLLSDAESVRVTLSARSRDCTVINRCKETGASYTVGRTVSINKSKVFESFLRGATYLRISIFFEGFCIFFNPLWISSGAVRRRLSVRHVIPWLFAAICIQVGAAQIGVTPVPRTDRNSQIAHEQLIEKARRGGIDVYFVGDSITRRWGTSDAAYRDFYDNWRRNFFGWNAANFGWGADAVQNILWRVSNGELDGVNPKIVVLLAGTNNVGNAPRDGVDSAVVNEVAEGTRAIISVMRAKAPDATIVITGVTPRRDRNGGTTVMTTIDAINTRLASLATGP